MIVRRTALAAWPRSVLMTLALLALAVRVLVPPGYMTPDRPTSGFSLVICTDHGLITLDDDGKQAPGKPKGDAPCAFAGGMAPPAPTVAVLTSFEGWAPAPLRVEPRQDLAPGRGLAAPPPPAIGPPVLI
jgi:hypothetical protein